MRPATGKRNSASSSELVPRVSVYAGYSRRSYGNLFATQNTAVTNASYTPYCITVPTDSRLPDTGGQQCGYFDSIRPTAPDNLVQSSNNFGGLEDVYDGFDFDANAASGRREPSCRAALAWAGSGPTVAISATICRLYFRAGSTPSSAAPALSRLPGRLPTVTYTRRSSLA